MKRLRIKLSCIIMSCFIGLFTANITGADEIVLENGDRLTGTVTTIQNGVLTLKTKYSEPIKIKAASILRIKSDKPVDVHLTNGEVLSGALSSIADKQVEVSDSPERKSTVVAWDAISAVNPPARTEIKWIGNISLAGSLQSGNTNNKALAIGGQAQRKTEKDRISGRVLYNYGEDDDVRNTENFYGALKYDYNLRKMVYVYLSVEALKDAFKDLKLRTVIGPGIGYQIWDDSRKSLSIEGGISYFNEDYYTGTDDSWITARLGGNFRYNITSSIVFTDQLLIYPSLENGGYKLRNEAGISTKLAANWSLNFSNIFEYDSDPAPSIKSDDTLWLIGLLYSF